MTNEQLADLIDRVRATDQRLLDAVDGLTDALVTGPSRLPGWTRGHVLAHLVGLGGGAARQLENAAAGTERVDFYDGGRAARDLAIESGAGAGAAEHADALRRTVARLEAALDRLRPEVLDQPTGYRDRPVSAVVLLWWREAEIHLTDLDLGVASSSWTGTLREHLVAYLADRVPSGTRFDLVATDLDERHSLGDGEVVTIRGTATDLVAWRAGREPLGPVTAEHDGAPQPLPELAPWP